MICRLHITFLLILIACAPPSRAADPDAATPTAAVIISEVYYYNTPHRKTQHRVPDWVELTAIGTGEVNIGGFILHDGFDRVVVFEAGTTLKAGETIVVTFATTDEDAKPPLVAQGVATRTMLATGRRGLDDRGGQIILLKPLADNSLHVVDVATWGDSYLSYFDWDEPRATIRRTPPRAGQSKPH